MWVEPGFTPLHHRGKLGTDAEIIDGVLAAGHAAAAQLGIGFGLMVAADRTLPVADAETITLQYRDPQALLRDLRSAGESNAVALRDRRIPPRALFHAALSQLPMVDGRVPATLRLAMLTGWAPSPGQPQPLARGSAKTSLADALRGA